MVNFRNDILNAEIKAVKAAIKSTKEKRMFVRYQTIVLFLHGMTYEQISIIVGKSTATIGNYIRAYREGGLDGMAIGKSLGRPPFLTHEQQEELRKHLMETRPTDVGFPVKKNWNSFLVRSWIEQEFDVKFTDRGVRKLLQQMGFSYSAKLNPSNKKNVKPDSKF